MKEQHLPPGSKTVEVPLVHLLLLSSTSNFTVSRSGSCSACRLSVRPGLRFAFLELISEFVPNSSKKVAPDRKAAGAPNKRSAAEFQQLPLNRRRESSETERERGGQS